MNPDDIKTTEDTAPSNIESNDKAEWEAAKEAAPHPYEGNIGIGEFTKNGSLNRITDIINDKIQQEVSYTKETIIQDLYDILYDKKMEAKSEIVYSIINDMEKEYNLSDGDIDIIMKGSENETNLHNRIDDIIDMEMEINIG